MSESVLGVLAGFTGWILLSVALSVILRSFEYPKGYRTGHSITPTALGPESGNGSRSGGDS